MSRYLVFTLLLLCNIATQAGPKVVFDSGRTISSDKYLSELQSKPAPKQKPNISKLATPHTPEMTVGDVIENNKAALAKQFNLKHYPVLITRTQIAQ